jgi:hypothetical protein
LIFRKLLEEKHNLHQEERLVPGNSSQLTSRFGPSQVGNTPNIDRSLSLQNGGDISWIDFMQSSGPRCMYLQAQW